MGGCYVKVVVESVHCGARGGPICPLIPSKWVVLMGGARSDEIPLHMPEMG